MSQQHLNRKTAGRMRATGDAAEVLAVLNWARENGVEVASVAVGTCSVQLARAVPTERREREQAVETHQQAIYRRFGGEMLDRAIQHETVEGADMQPVVGRRM